MPGRTWSTTVHFQLTAPDPLAVAGASCGAGQHHASEDGRADRERPPARPAARQSRPPAPWRGLAARVERGRDGVRQPARILIGREQDGHLLIGFWSAHDAASGPYDV